MLHQPPTDWVLQNKNKVRGTLSHCHYIKKYLKAKEKLWKFKHLTMQKYNLQNPLKATKILQDIITV
jgi:hypothetical protein